MIDNMTDSTTPSNGNGRRRQQLIIAAGVFALLGAIWFAYWMLVARFIESTDDAYVSGNIVQVTPQISGTVVAIYAEDTHWVKAGQPLIKLDDTTARVALQKAEANLAQTVREVRALYNGNDSLRARINLQQTELAKARSDFSRRKGLDSTGAVSREEMHHLQTAVDAAEADLLSAREDLAANLALTDNTSVIDHPQVKAAAAALKDAYLEVERTVIPAAVDGYVSKRRVQLGQRVSPGTPLMAVIPLSDLWVDANFKESQLAHIRIGQPVSLTADIYGNTVTYHGQVEGLEAGTGSAFSLLPAQNATGNWIKVVQRVPVRIALDPAELAENPLRIGLSTIAEVDISDDSGPSLLQQSSDGAVYQTRVYDDKSQAADELVASIISANMGPDTNSPLTLFNPIK